MTRAGPTPEAVACIHCGCQIVGCWGRFGEWKHERTNRERCEDGRLATPFSISPHKAAS